MKRAKYLLCLMILSTIFITQAKEVDSMKTFDVQAFNENRKEDKFYTIELPDETEISQELLEVDGHTFYNVRNTPPNSPYTYIKIFYGNGKLFLGATQFNGNPTGINNV